MSMINVRRLIWDAFNVPHIARHDVALEEVEQACHGDHIARESYERRLMLIGPTESGRLLVVILAPRGNDVYYPVTAYAAGRRLQRIYEAERGGESGHDEEA
jgi:uncharacterized DUF497 family protein